MSYIEVTKRRFAGANMPNDIIRVNKKTLSLSPNVAETFQQNRETTTSGREVVQMGIAIDVDTKRIKLLPTSLNGFRWSSLPNNTNGTLNVNQPAGFKQAGLPKGDYQLVNSRELEFEYAQ